MSLTVHELTIDRVVPCLGDLHAADLDELQAAGIVDVHEMLMQALPLCSWAQEARWHGEPIAAFGVRPLPGGDVGVPWMLTMRRMDEAQRVAVARAAVRSVRRMRREFVALVNLVHRHNERAIRFVEWLGFRVEPEFTGPGYAFRRFHWRRDDV